MLLYTFDYYFFIFVIERILLVGAYVELTTPSKLNGSMAFVGKLSDSVLLKLSINGYKDATRHFKLPHKH